MTDLMTAARPYVNALNQLNADKSWLDFLAKLETLLLHAQLRKLLLSDIVSIQDKLELLASILQDFNAQQQNFVHIILLQGKLQAIPQILKLFKNIHYKKTKKLKLKITSANSYTKAFEAKLRKAVRARGYLDASFELEQDSSLIAGALVKIEDRVLDGSVKQQLTALYQQIKG